MKKKFLILGSGGREHALVWHFKQNNHSVECAPGSDAIAEMVECWNFSDFDDLYQKTKEHQIDGIIVGPEAYLAKGISDVLQKKGLPIFGPNKSATRLESDKAWAKSFCKRNQIPTARAVCVRSKDRISTTLKNFHSPYVIKASGLAGGKGVLICDQIKEAEDFSKKCLESHDSVVIEDFLNGEEVSCFYMVDSQSFSFIGAAQDHKRLCENDQGPNTGGMGAYSTPPFFSPELRQQIETEVLTPCLSGLEKEGIHYRGFLFLGLMLVNENIYLLEFNCRMGDPETQGIVLRLKTSLPEIMSQLSEGKKIEADFYPGVSMNVVLAAKGYPQKPLDGFELPGIENPPKDAVIFHSGTKKTAASWLAKGGRLFSVACRRESLVECQNIIYPWIENLNFLTKVSYRKDIGAKAYRHLFNTRRKLSHG